MNNLSQFRLPLGIVFVIEDDELCPNLQLSRLIIKEVQRWRLCRLFWVFVVGTVIRTTCTPYDSGLRKRTYLMNPHDQYLFQSQIFHLPVIFAAIIHKVGQQFKLCHVRSTENRSVEDPLVFQIQATSQLGSPKTPVP